MWQRQSQPILPSEPIGRLVAQVLRRLQLEDRAVELTLVGDEEIRELNRKFLGRDRSTNVLSFEGGEPAGLGELIVNVDFAVR